VRRRELLYELFPDPKVVERQEITYMGYWFQGICGRDIERAIERVELVLSQEEMDREDLEGQNYPIEIVRGLNLQGLPDFKWDWPGMTRDAANHEGCGPMKWRPIL
jgi:hypothetical protein